jgi:hypothetical protein
MSVKEKKRKKRKACKNAYSGEISELFPHCSDEALFFGGGRRKLKQICRNFSKWCRAAPEDLRTPFLQLQFEKMREMRTS